MSDGSNPGLGHANGNGDTQAATLLGVIGADTTPFERGMANVQRSSVSTLQSISAAFGNETPFGPYLNVLSSVSYAFSNLVSDGGKVSSTQRTMKTSVDSTSTSLDMQKTKVNEVKTAYDQWMSATSRLFYLSAAVAAVGGALTAISAPLQRANADLSVAIGNTTDKQTGLNNSVDDYKDQINSAVSLGAKYGYSQDQIRESLARLTIASGDPIRAFRDLKTAEELSLRPGLDLQNAVNMLGKAYGGNMRIFTNVGLKLPQIETTERALARATNELTSAQDQLSKATQALSDFQSEMADKMAKAQEVWSQRVSDATDRVSKAQQNYQEVSQKVAIDDEQLRIQLADQAVSAAKKVGDAEKNLADLEEKLARERRDAAQSLQDVLLDIQMNPAATGEEQIRQQERLRDAQQKVADQQKDSASQTKDAQQQVSDAVAEQVDVRKQQLALDERELIDKRALEAATNEQTAAQAALKAAQDGLNASQTETLAQQHQERDLAAAIVADKKKVLAAQEAVNDAGKQQEKIFADIDAGSAATDAKQKGQLDARANSWAGLFRRLKADATNWFEDMGNKFGGFLGTIGIVGLAITGLGRAAGWAGGMLGLGGGGGAGAAEGGSLLADFVPGADLLAGGAGAAALGTGAEAAGGSLLALGGVIAAVVVAVGVAGYAIYHWRKDLGQWFKDLGNDIYHFFDGLWQDLDKVYQKFYDWGKSLIQGFWNGVQDIWHGLSDGWHNFWKGLGDTVSSIFKFGSPSKLFHGYGANVVIGFINGAMSQRTKLEQAMTDIFTPTPPGGAKGAPAPAYGGASGGNMVMLDQRTYVDVKGSIVTEKELWSRLRDLDLRESKRNGGDIYGGTIR